MASPQLTEASIRIAPAKRAAIPNTGLTGDEIVSAPSVRWQPVAPYA